MSLQVWLPLNGDLHNQGINKNIEISSIGALTFVDNGKIGKCYQRAINSTQTTTGININSNLLNLLGTKASVAMWVKPLGTHTHYNGTLLSSGNWNAKRWAFGVDHDNTKVDVLCGGYNTYINCAVPVNEWTHLCSTFDNGVSKLYKNGIYIGQLTGKAGFDSDATNTCIGRETYAGGYFGFNGLINDVRIYNNVLSEKQIKEISKGLILHYPLNRRGWGQDNLMPNSLTIPVGSASASTGTWRLAGDSKMSRSRVAISDSPLWPLAYGLQSIGLQTSADASCWGIDNFPRQSGVVYTISAWGRIVGGSSTAAMLGFSLYNANSLNYGGENGPAKSSDIEYYGNGALNYDYAGGKLKSNGNWTRVWRTFSSTSTSGNIYIGFNTATTGDSVTVQLCGIKLEKGEKVTPWCPNVSEIQDFYTIMNIDSNLQYDTSGYQNNGIRHGTFTWDSNTPIHNISTNATGNASTYLEGPILPSTVQTVSLWIKGNKSTNSAIFNDKITGLQIGLLNSLLYINSKASTKGFKTTHWKNGQWNHVVAINDNGTRSVYVNGQKETQSGASNYYVHQADHCWLWNRSYNNNYPFSGSLSDLRIYVTVLSAEDVLSLYNNGAYIDQLNEIHGKVR